MSQVTFGAATTPQLTDLDANFTELYDLRNRITTPSFTAPGPRIVIDSSGNVYAAAAITVNPGVQLSPTGAVNIGNSAQASGWSFALFTRSGVQIGGITQSALTGVSYNTSSDYRLKDSVAPLVGSGAFIDALKPCTWSWKVDGSVGTGFIAHELQAVSPSSVTGAKDAVQDVGDVKDSSGAVISSGVPKPPTIGDGETWVRTGVAPVYQAVEYGSAEVIAMMVAELKALRLRVAALGG